MTTDLFGLLKNATCWGMNRIRAPSTIPEERSLEVFCQSTDGSLSLIGRLFCEEGEYVFRYDSSYTGEPISAFPTMQQEYRSKILWPFFATRIPPFDREDMRNEITKRHLREDQIIEILGEVAKVSSANPYEFRMAGG